MSKLPTYTFSKTDKFSSGTIVFLIADKGKLPSKAEVFNKAKQLTRAMSDSEIPKKTGQIASILAPKSGVDRVLIASIGKFNEKAEADWLKLGGKIYAAAGKSKQITILCDLSNQNNQLTPDQQAQIAAGMKLRAYKFDKYLTVKASKEPAKKIKMVSTIATSASKAFKQMDGVCDGVILARDLVNEPANKLGAVEFAAAAKKLTKLGCKVEVFDEKKLRQLKMGSLLSVNEGSIKPPRLAIMQWNGGKKGEKPVAFVGKGVTFDTGGISIKPSGGMEDMKGDMGGAAAVTGLMHALAARKARVNAVGVIGLVENMPDAKATRPGDVIASMSGQTIEVINTDAEGRLVLADALWYTEGRFKPKFMINLATLTGAVLIALGKEHAGLFSNDDKLSEQLAKAGMDTDEKVWRLPLHAAYDKLIDTKNADVKNTGGRLAGSITAAQFLQRFVRDTPWAHLDVAGTAMAAPQSEYNQSWGSGYGVRLLDRLVANNYEK